jgi:hypothetical protein
MPRWPRSRPDPRHRSPRDHPVRRRRPVASRAQDSSFLDLRQTRRRLRRGRTHRRPGSRHLPSPKWRCATDAKKPAAPADATISATWSLGACRRRSIALRSRAISRSRSRSGMLAFFSRGRVAPVSRILRRSHRYSLDRRHVFTRHSTRIWGGRRDVEPCCGDGRPPIPASDGQLTVESRPTCESTGRRPGEAAGAPRAA